MVVLVLLVLVLGGPGVLGSWFLVVLVLVFLVHLFLVLVFLVVLVLVFLGSGIPGPGFLGVPDRTLT